MKNEIITKENIENMIYEIRGVQVMLDSDLAMLYDCANGTKSINLAVKRNFNKFPNDIYFQLNEIEFNHLKFQSETSSSNEHGGIRKLPFVFTEEGVAMLATVLHTKVADEMSLKIIRAFVAMRKYISQNLIEQKYINNLVIKNDERLTIVENTLDKLNEKQKVNTIFYKGQIYDAYIVFMEILERAKEEIIIIDEYAGKELFKMIKSIKKKIIIITSNIDDNHKKIYEKQYQNIEIKKDDKFHDRFIIVDRKVLYHSGASFKDLGNKCCCISLIENENMLKEILKELDV